MRHGMVNRKLGRTSAHRNALFRNQLSSLIDRERIITTLPKAKELRPQIERLITLARTDSQHTRRLAARNGGYTRIVKLGPRRGDAAEMAILEFVGYELQKDEEPAKETKAAKKKAAPAKEKEEASSDEEKPAK